MGLIVASFRAPLTQTRVAASLVAIYAVLCADPARPETDETCMILAGRLLKAMERLAVGTRHAAQIATSMEEGGGRGRMIVRMADGMNADDCALSMLMSDGAIEGMAASMLPELQE